MTAKEKILLDIKAKSKGYVDLRTASHYYFVLFLFTPDCFNALAVICANLIEWNSILLCRVQ